MKKAYFQYYETFENVLEKIKDIEEREHMRKTIINYGLYGTLPAGLSELEEMAWTICKDLIDQQQHRREVNAANRAGKKADPPVIIRINNGAEEIERPLQNPEPEEKAAQEIQPEKPKRKNFVKPTVEEIAAYCKEKNYNVNAQQFFNYYESNGWKIGRNAMKSWQAAVQNWNTRDKANNKAAGTMWANNSTDADTAGYEDLF
ncbi:DUF6291 domain-containing protein [uncultured Treponema sp.]|mgnify:CR=1 FL=1|uniref:DUF6291 domain-containing protein n=1 Tax=uncultured Treponema sp. TaxID=162155 RepID=UPI0025EA04BA|nr:DUF6291 domain-containing protein [uncultured Treponema sp.]